MSWLSQALKAKFGAPEINLLQNPTTAPFLKPLIDGLTRENFRKAIRQLDDDTFAILGEEMAADAERRGL